MEVDALCDYLTRLESDQRVRAAYRHEIGDIVGVAARLGAAGLAKHLREMLDAEYETYPEAEWRALGDRLDRLATANETRVETLMRVLAHAD